MKTRKLILMSVVFSALLFVTNPIRANAQQPTVSKENVTESIMDARTSADHESIAAFYRQEAADANKKADLHERVADTYRKVKIAKPVFMAEMCDNLAADFRKTATDENKLAAIHEQIAKQTESK